MKVSREADRLYCILDDVDSLPDMYHPITDDAYRQVVKYAVQWANNALDTSVSGDEDPDVRFLRDLLHEIVRLSSVVFENEKDHWIRINGVATRTQERFDSDGYDVFRK